MTPGIHEYEYSRLPVLMNMNNVFKYKCVSNLQVKPGYTRKSPGIPEKYPSARPHAAHAYSQGHCANCGAHRLLKYAHRTMCARYKCQKAASAQRQARLAGGGADDAVVPTFCYKIEAVLGMRFCDPDQLIGKKRRNRLAAADNTICYLTRGTFKEDQHDAGFADTRWVELEELYENCGKAQLNGAVKKYRKAEDEAVKAAIAEFEEGIED